MLLALLRRAAVATSLACLVLSPGTAAMAIGDGGTMTVSGRVVETVRFGVDDAVEDLEAYLASGCHARTGADRADVVEIGGSDASVCYVASGEIVVSSNVAYDLLVSGRSPRAGLRFLTAVPGSFAACASGEPISHTMFAADTPTGTWVSGQSRTSERIHPFALGLIVGPGDDPLAMLETSTFTVLAQASG